MIGKSRGSTARCALSIIDTHPPQRARGGRGRWAYIEKFCIIAIPSPHNARGVVVYHRQRRRARCGGWVSLVVSIVLHYYGLGQVLKKRCVGVLALQHNKTTSGAPGGGVWKFFFQSWSQRPPRAHCQGWGWPGWRRRSSWRWGMEIFYQLQWGDKEHRATCPLDMSITGSIPPLGKASM